MSGKKNRLGLALLRSDLTDPQACERFNDLLKGHSLPTILTQTAPPFPPSFAQFTNEKLPAFSETVVFQEEPVEPGSYPRAPLVDEGVPPLNKDQQRQDGLGC